MAPREIRRHNDFTLEEIKALSDEEIMSLSMPRPGHPEARGFLFKPDIRPEIAAALIERLSKASNPGKQGQTLPKPRGHQRTQFNIAWLILNIMFCYVTYRAGFTGYGYNQGVNRVAAGGLLWLLFNGVIVWLAIAARETKRD